MLNPETLKQTVCPVCKEAAPLTPDGTVGEHDPYRDAGFTISIRCEGIGRPGQRTDKLKRAS